MSTSLESSLVASGGGVTPARSARALDIRTEASAPAITRNPSTTHVLGALQRVTVRQSVREILSHRDLLVQLATRDVRIRYKQAVMGFAWALLMPLLIVGAGTLIRIAMVAMTGMHLDKGELGAVVLKSFPWAFFSGALGFAVNSVTGNVALVTKIYFPRAILPIAAVAANLLDLAVGVVVMLVALPFLGAQFTFALLWVPLLVLLLVLVTAGLGIVLSCANLFYRDVKYIVQVVLTFGIFLTPVFFEIAAFGRRGSKFLIFNPLTPIFEGLTQSVIHGHNLLLPATTMLRGVPVTSWEPWYLLYSIVWAFGSVALGLVLFQRTQFLFAEYA